MSRSDEKQDNTSCRLAANPVLNGHDLQAAANRKTIDTEPNDVAHSATKHLRSETLHFFLKSHFAVAVAKLAVFPS